jgi:hypothetical protein
VIRASCQLDLPVGVLPLDAGPTGALAAIRSVTQLPQDPVYTHRVALYSDFFGTPPGAATPAMPLFGETTSEPFLDWLTTGTEAVVLHVHGNGADLRVGTEVLCVQVGADRPTQAKPDERYLPCQGGGRCRLEHKTSFRAFHGPSVMRSRLVVLLSCSGFHPSDGLLDDRFTFSGALRKGNHVRGVITSTMINFGTPELAVATMATLDAGATLGELASKINRVPGYGPPSYLCLGDPDLRLNGPPIVDPPTIVPLLRPALVQMSTGHCQTVSNLFTADVVTASTPNSHSLQLGNRLRIRALGPGQAGDTDTAVDGELAEAIVLAAADSADGTFTLHS